MVRLGLLNFVTLLLRCHNNLQVYFPFIFLCITVYCFYIVLFVSLNNLETGKKKKNAQYCLKEAGSLVSRWQWFFVSLKADALSKVLVLVPLTPSPSLSGNLTFRYRESSKDLSYNILRNYGGASNVPPSFVISVSKHVQAINRAANMLTETYS